MKAGQGTTADTAERALDVAERLVQERGFNGVSYADVAAELGVPVGTVKSRVFHALRGLRGALNAAA